jgi:ADP-heptose:LPS heptosyltransferase
MQGKIDHQSGSCVAGKSIFIQTEGVTAWEERFPVMKKFSFRFQVLPALLRLLFPHPQKQPLPSVKSVVCIRPGKLGDMFVATPLFSALKNYGGVKRLAVICSPENEIVVRHNPFIDVCKVINFHRIGAVVGVIGWMRRQRFDAVFDLTPGFSRTNFLMSYGSGSRTVRAGIEKEIMADCYHVHVGNRTTHLTDRILEAGELLTASSFPRQRVLEIFSSVQDRAAAASFIDRCGGSDGLVAINLSSATASRQWPCGHFAALIALLNPISAIRKLALIGVGPQARWAETLALLDERCIAAPAMSFPAVTEIISACRLLISTDTALIHAAAARGVPVIALYVGDAEALSRWKPYHGLGRVIQAPPGRPVAAIEPETVLDETLKIVHEIDMKAASV